MSTLISRKQFIQSTLVASAAMLSVSKPVSAQTLSSGNKGSTMQLTQEWDKTFPKSNKVDHQKVTFKNSFGITLAGDVYLPKNRGNQALATLVVAGPFGAVKEQSSGLYAQTMAERGFATIAFDPSFTGESSGEPRNIASPDISTEDFSAAVDYMGTQKFVDRNRVGILGICGLAGMALNAAAIDKRVKAVAVSTMYDMSRLISNGYNDSGTLEQKTKLLEMLGQQRWADAEKGITSYGPSNLPEKLTGKEPEFLASYFDYYRTPRGFHKRSLNSAAGWGSITALSFMSAPLMTHIKEISPRPVLIMVGEKAHSRYFSEDTYKAAAEPKELVIVPNAVHVDLYDKVDKIPFAKLDTFFKTNLK